MSDGRSWAGGPVGERARCVLAPNPGPMTLDGTNTWLLHEPGADVGVVVDPGPDHEGHLHAVLAAAGAQGLRVGQVLLTHGHPDHAEGAAPVRRPGGGRGSGRSTPRSASVPRGWPTGTSWRSAVSRSGWSAPPGTRPTRCRSCCRPTVRCSPATPCSAAGPRSSRTRTAGSPTTWPRSNGCRRLASDGSVRRVLPGHGPVLDDPAAVLAGYLAHRHERLEQVARAVGAGDRTPRAVVERVYADVDRALWPAAELQRPGPAGVPRGALTVAAAPLRAARGG